MKRYLSINDYCKQTFNEKVYRLSLDAGMTCPNRDGSISSGGCFFCSEGGSGDFATGRDSSITKQLEKAKERLRSKTNCKKFIAYFQSFTNTYAPVTVLRKIFTEAILRPEIVALSIGTRSDCLPSDVIELLAELNQIKPVWVELGLQTIHNETHKRLNTHTTLEQFDKALLALTSAGIPVVAHLILGLPNETKEMMLDSVSYVAHSSVWGVKLQLLHVLKNTVLEKQYLDEPFPIFSLEEYCDFVIDCVERLHPSQVIHRLTGDGPRNLLVAPLWSTDKKRVLNTITMRFEERDTYQGRLFE